MITTIRGITYRDQWQAGATKKNTGKQYLFMVWDKINRDHVRGSFSTIPEGREWAEKKHAELALGLDGAKKAIWEEVGKDFAKSRDEAGVSNKHIVEIKRIVKALALAGAKDMKRDSFQIIVRKFLEEGTSFAKERFNHPTVGNYTRRKWLQQIRSIVNHAIKRRLLTYNPLGAIRSPVIDVKEKATFTLEELRSLVSDNRKEDPYFLRFCLLIYTGCRIREAVNLRWEDIDYVQERVHVKLQTTYRLKRRRERSLPLLRELREILAPIGQLRGFIVNDEKSRNAGDKTQWTMFRAYLKRCKLLAGGRSPHSTRHTWISLLLATDVNAIQVQQWAGHKDIVTTTGYAAAQDSYRRAVRDWERGEFSLREAAPQIAKMNQKLVEVTQACVLIR